MKRIIKDSVLLRICAVLVVLLLVSLYLASGYLAKYVTDDNRSEDSGIASFDFVINNNQTITLDLSDIKGPGDSKEFTFAVLSPDTNEVKVEYLVELQTSNNLPLDITLTPGTGEEVTSEEATGTGIVYAVSSTALVAPNVELSETFTVNVEWPSDRNDVSYSGVNEAVCVSVSGIQIV